MSRIVRSFHWSFRVSKSRQPSIATALLALALMSAGLVGCSSDEPPPAAAGANQAQAGAAPQAMPAMPGAMPGPGGVAPAGAPGGGAANIAGANPNAAAAMAGANPAGAGAPPNSNPPTAGADPAAAAAAAAFANPAGAGVPPGVVPNAAGAVAANPAGAGVPPNANLQAGVAIPNAGAVAPGAAAGAAGPGGAGFAGAGGVNAGGANGGQGAPQNPQSQPGTADFSAESIAIQVLKGDVSSLEQFISPKCKGVLGDIRDGKATEKQIDELKKLFVGIKPIGARNENGTRVLTIRNADNATITFKVKKEGEDFKVLEMTTKPGPKKIR